MDLAHARLGDLCQQTLPAMEKKKAVDDLRIQIDTEINIKCKCKVCVEAVAIWVLR